MDNNKITIALIHNNEERVYNLKKNINELINRLVNFRINFEEIYYQPKIREANIFLCLYRDFIHRRLIRKWRKYIMKKNKLLLIDILLFIYRFLQKYIYKKKFTTNLIEMYVTDKHIRALSEAIKNKSNYLLVLESDAVFQNNSIENITIFLHKILEIKNIPVYVDLAGGLPLEVLSYNKLIYKKSSNYIEYTKPVTNTACCYLINRIQMKLFYDLIISNPKYRYIGIDHLFNKLFTKQINNKVQSKCYHAYPPIINHGSFTGDFKSWNSN